MTKNKTPEVLALIPARSGSKGIPGKNVKDLFGHPLMAYSIGVAQLSPFITRIILTTDSEEYAAIGRKYGAETPFIRPAQYAQDSSGDIDYHKHALDWLEENEKYIPELMVILRPTAPVRDAAILNKAIEMALANPKATAVRTAHLVERTPYKMFRIKEGYAQFYGSEDFDENTESMNISRQFLPTAYEINGYIDVARPSVLENDGLVYGRRVLPIITEKAADIDELSDFRFAEKTLDKSLVRFLNQKKEGFKK
jgi:CMP-N,N'-diacetyllegionaminic acid synthase